MVLRLTSAALLAAGLTFGSAARADSSLSYQGRITDSTGAGIASAELTAHLFETAAATTPVVTLGPFLNVVFRDGVFSLPLGLTEAQIDALFGAGKRAHVQIVAKLPNGASLTLPRQELGTVPLALRVPIGAGLRFDNDGKLVVDIDESHLPSSIARDSEVPSLLAPGAIGESAASTVKATEVRLPDADGTVVTLRANAATPSNFTLTLPVNDGNNGNLLITDGNGNLSWAAPSGGGDMFAATYDGAGGSQAGVVDNAEKLNGRDESFLRDASNLNAGEIADARIPATIARDAEIPTSLPPSGAAGGALSGNFPNPTLADDAVVTAKILDGTILDADIAPSGITTAGKVSGGAITSGTIGGTAGFAGSGGVTLSGTPVGPTELRFREDTDDGVNYVALRAPATLASDVTLTLPGTLGSPGEVLSVGMGGVLSWTSQTADTDTNAKTLCADGEYLRGEAVTTCRTASQIVTDGSGLKSADLGVSVQGFDATLGGIAATEPVANELVYATGANTFATTPLTAAARSLLDDASLSAVATTLGAGAASGLATLDAGSKVVQDPANATATPTGSKIPIAGVGGTLALGWLPATLAGKDADTVDGIEGASLVQTSRSISAGAGLSGGGDLSADRALSLDIAGLTTETTADNAHLIPIYDSSATALRNMTRATFLAGLGDGHSLDASDGSATDVLFVDPAGKVGIGTTSPSDKFHVVQPAASGNALRLDGGASGVTMQIVGNSAGMKLIGHAVSALGSNTYNANALAIRADDGIQLATSNSGANGITIATNGYVGIGTTSPATRLEVQTSVDSAGASVDVLTLTQTNPTPDNGEGPAILMRASDSAGNIENVARIVGLINPNTNGSEGSSLLFFTRTSGTSLSERMVINPSGYLGVGNNLPNYLLDLALDPATTNTMEDVVNVARRTSGTAANGIGAGLLFSVEDAAGAYETAGRVGAVLSNAANGAETSALTFATRNSGGSLTEQVRISGEGNVGIGTSSPAFALDVRPKSGGDPAMRVSTPLDAPVIISFDGGNSAAQNRYLLFNDRGTEKWRLGANGSNRFFLHDTAAGVDVLTANAGNVGFGDVTPDAKVEVVGTLMVSSAAANDGDRLFVNASGNVGIGTNIPSERLDLGGGNIAMGWERVENSCGSVLNCTATCTSTKRAVGGSCAASGSWVIIYASGTASSYVCSAQFPPTWSLIAIVYCANVR